MNNLRCPCPHHDIVAQYDDKTVVIKGKHGCFSKLQVIDGKLQQVPYSESEEKVLREAFLK